MKSSEAALPADKSDVLIIAAEASSALYALRLIEHWKSEKREIRAFGIGDREMEAAGFDILGRAEELAVTGLLEVLAHYDQIKKTFYRVLEEVDRRKPKVAILMDYPGFNLRLAKELKKRGVKVVYYISPQVWAWKQGRVKTIRKYVDEMLVLFPFEDDFYKKHGVTSQFVGHPLLDELDASLFQDAERRRLREKHGIPGNRLVLGLMPGSRRSEIKNHLTVQVRAAEILKEKNPDLTVALLIAPTLQKDEIVGQLPELNFPLQVVQRTPFEMIAMCDVILCASGTATLMVGLLEKPMLIMYRAHPITVFIGRLVVKSKFWGLVNLIMDYEICPERLQIDAPEIARLMEPLIGDEVVRRNKAHELADLKNRLGEKGATGRVAHAVERYL